MDAVREYLLLSRVCSDQGREYYLVVAYMLEHRGEGRGSMITGSSIHKSEDREIMHCCVTV